MNTLAMLERAGLVEPITGTRLQVRVAAIRARVMLLLGLAVSTMVAYILTRTIDAWNAGVGLSCTAGAFVHGVMMMLPGALACSAVANVVRLVDVVMGQRQE